MIVLTIATLVGVLFRCRNGVLRVSPGAGSGAGSGRVQRLSAAELGVPLGETATLVHFSTAFCQPCRATRRVLGEVAGMVSGVTHVEIDAETNLDLIRRLKVMRTPTVLVLDPSGAIVRRASGQPRVADVVAALGEVQA
ncbi:MAG: thioredoxin family protein [Sporichthyaceae bacterium]|nr:thioredoxin family protein [Sporichthyaceae bacterium]